VDELKRGFLFDIVFILDKNDSIVLSLSERVARPIQLKSTSKK
jgi:hypothetical protein